MRKTNSDKLAILLITLISPFALPHCAESCSPVHPEPKQNNSKPCPPETAQIVLARAMDALLAHDDDNGIALFSKYCSEYHFGFKTKKAALQNVLKELQQRSTDKPAKLAKLRQSLEEILASDYFKTELRVFEVPASDGCIVRLHHDTAKPGN